MSKFVLEGGQSLKRQQWWRTGLGLVALLAGLVVGVGLIQQMPAWRADLTEDQLYTLTDGSLNILSSVEQPLSLQFFFSDKVSQELPQLRDYAKRVRELLQEYALNSHGKITLEIIDPEPFSDEEDRAAEYGLQGVPSTMGGDAIYFGLVGANPAGEQQVIGFFNPERESFLEYDISQMVYRLVDAQQMVVGLITEVSAMGGYDYARRQPGETWLVMEQLQKLATVKKLDSELDIIDADVDVLMVIHPSNLAESTRYAIDQYVLAGGNALIFVDPHFEMAAGGMMAMPRTNSSSLPALFKAWGVEYDPTQVMADGKWALRLAAGKNNLPLPHLGILGLQEEALLQGDITTAELETINVATAGAIGAKEGATTAFTPLVFSSDMSMMMPASQFVALQDHSTLLKTFDPQGDVHTVAARVTGMVSSAFPDGRPVKEKVDAVDGAEESRAASDEEMPKSPEEGAEAPALLPEHIPAASSEINVIIVADTDLLTDRLWVQVSNFFGQRVAAPWANNGDFVSNLVENLGGSADLISVRSRGKYSRPFQVVDELELNAAQHFREQEQVLIQKLEELEASIQQLSQSEGGQAILELSDEQQAEVKVFEQEKLAIRKELRQVQHQLNKDIEALEVQMKLINIALVPGLLTLGVIALAWVRSRRRRQPVDTIC